MVVYDRLRKLKKLPKLYLAFHEIMPAPPVEAQQKRLFSNCCSVVIGVFFFFADNKLLSLSGASRELHGKVISRKFLGETCN